MKPPAEDLANRAPLWDVYQMFWMDTDPGLFLEQAARVSAESQYGMEDLEHIFWNEVRPAVAFNMWDPVAPDWAGYDLNWLTERILDQQTLPRRTRWYHKRYAGKYWNRIRAMTIELRQASIA